MRKKVKRFCNRDIRSLKKDDKDLNCWRASALKIPCSLIYVEFSFPTIRSPFEVVLIHCFRIRVVKPV